MTSRVTSKGQVTIPIALRERLGLQPGSTVQFTADGDAVRITKAAGIEGRGRAVVNAMRGRASTELSTEEIMSLTRGSV